MKTELMQIAEIRAGHPFRGAIKESTNGNGYVIQIRDQNEDGQIVVVIDGGYKENGQALIDHIRQYYNTEKVDLVISTHPDQDHINGLSTILEELDVSELWIHKAWEHNDGLASKFQDGRITDNSIGERLKENLQSAYDLVKLAESKNITIREPFTGEIFDSIKVLSPTKSYYEELLPQFNGMPQTKAALDEFSLSSLLESAFNKAKKVFKTVCATWGEDQIDNEDTTSPKNNSSVITQIITGNRRLLFTGDAGITALDKAADEIDRCFDNAELRFFQIPHHGSKRNVGPDVLNRIIGEPVAKGETREISAIASSAKEGAPKHPHASVLNAFKHRGISGAKGTKGSTVRFHYEAPINIASAGLFLSFKLLID